MKDASLGARATPSDAGVADTDDATAHGGERGSSPASQASTIVAI
jgi:hypothetical protein